MSIEIFLIPLRQIYTEIGFILVTRSRKKLIFYKAQKHNVLLLLWMYTN